MDLLQPKNHTFNISSPYYHFIISYAVSNFDFVLSHRQRLRPGGCPRNRAQAELRHGLGREREGQEDGGGHTEGDQGEKEDEAGGGGGRRFVIDM